MYMVKITGPARSPVGHRISMVLYWKTSNHRLPSFSIQSITILPILIECLLYQSLPKEFEAPLEYQLYRMRH